VGVYTHKSGYTTEMARVGLFGEKMRSVRNKDAM